ncbi:MAG: hypothetical protein NT003_04735 [Candidatus Magasanikbacteria bacterium]|nr:hypothetical protein [Candidatus Magasanikbacteria bacterium]
MIAPIKLAQLTWGDAMNQTQTAGNIAWGAGRGDLMQVIGGIIYVVLSLLSMLFLIFAVVAGLKWATAHGDKKIAENARNSLKNNVLGMIVIVGAYALTRFLVSLLGTIAAP